MDDARRLTPLTRSESLRLLRSVSLGRVVFTHLALPAIRPVNHLVDGEVIIIRFHHGSAVTSALATGEGTVVAYEADTLNPDNHLGWSVIVVGRARRVTDPTRIARYREALRPWVSGTYDDIVAIDAEVVDGFRLVPDEERGGVRARPS